MPSLSRCCATVTSLLLPLFLTLVFGIQGATLREHRLSGTEPASFGPGSQLRPPPSAEMLRALQYIQSLSQRTAPEPVSDDLQPAAMDGERDDMENVRSMLRLAAPGRSAAGMGRGMDEREEDKDQDHTQQWLQAVLTTLQKTEEQMTPPKTPQKSPQNSSPSHPHYSIQPLPRPKQQVGTSAENYLANRRPHRQYPLLFEDEEGQEQPLKRTNENAEEQYTPQKLATLQSVFEELSRISASKTNSKRDSTAATTAENDDDDEDNDEDDDDLYRQRKMALEDIMGTDEWEPLEEQIETEEEERERHEYNRNLEDDEQEEEDEKEEEDDDVKRSSQSDLFQTEKGADPEDIAKLVDYYLLKVLEKKEQEEQKREDTRQKEEEEGDEDSDREEEKTDVDEEEEEGEEERDEVQRDIKPFQGPFPKSLSQLIKISQTLQIPPEEVLDLLQNERQKNFFGIPPRSQAQSRKPPRTYTITRGAQSAFAAAPHRRPLETPETNSVVRDILSILELASTAKQNDKFRQQPMRLKTSRYYERPRDLPDYVFPKSSRDDYDDTVDEEDELANYLASEMLAQGQRRARLTPPRDDERSAYGKLERAVQDYFDKTTSENKPSEQEGMTIDDDTMLKILRYLDPDTDSTAETDSEGKTVPEM